MAKIRILEKFLLYLFVVFHVNKKIKPECLHVTARRADVLECLHRGDRERQVIEAKTNQSRPTINRAIKELESTGLVKRGAGPVNITETGEIALRLYRRAKSEFQAIEALGRMNRLPDSMPLNSDDMQDMSVILPTRCSPCEPIDELRQHITHRHRLLALVSTAEKSMMRIVKKSLNGHKHEVKFVIPDSLTAAYSDYIGRKIHSVESMNITEEIEDFSVFVIPEKSLWIATHGEEGRTQGAIITHSERITRWGKDLVENESS